MKNVPYRDHAVRREKKEEKYLLRIEYRLITHNRVHPPFLFFYNLIRLLVWWYLMIFMWLSILINIKWIFLLNCRFIDAYLNFYSTSNLSLYLLFHTQKKIPIQMHSMFGLFLFIFIHYSIHARMHFYMFLIFFQLFF